MKKLTFIFLAACLAAATVVLVYPRKPSVLQLRLVLQNATPETEEMGHQNSKTGEIEVLHVLKRAAIDLAMIRSAGVAKVNEIPGAYVEIKLTEQGRQRFAEITRNNIGKRLAIIVDGKLIEAPKILEELSDGRFWIAGNFTYTEAAHLADLISRGLKR